MVIARTLDGEIGLLTNHAPMIGILYEGSTVQIRPDTGTGPTSSRRLPAASCPMADNRVSILARQASSARTLTPPPRRQPWTRRSRTAGPAADGPEEPAEHPVLPRAAARRRAGQLTGNRSGPGASGSVWPASTCARPDRVSAPSSARSACLVLRRGDQPARRRRGVLPACDGERPLAARPGRVPGRSAVLAPVAEPAAAPARGLRPPPAGRDRQPPGGARRRCLARAGHDDRDVPGAAYVRGTAGRPALCSGSIELAMSQARSDRLLWPGYEARARRLP